MKALNILQQTVLDEAVGSGNNQAAHWLGRHKKFHRLWGREAPPEAEGELWLFSKQQVNSWHFFLEPSPGFYLLLCTPSY